MTAPHRTISWRCSLLLAAALATASLRGTAHAQDEFETDAERLVAALALDTGRTVADIGAGSGQLTIALGRAVGPSGRVYATELDEDRLDTIRAAAETAGLRNVTVLEAHPARTNLPEGCCDALVLRLVYHHIGDPAAMNASLRQSLRPGGLLAVIDFRPDSTESADPEGRDTGEQHGVTPATVARELTQAGFELVTTDEGNGRRYMVVARRPA